MRNKFRLCKVPNCNRDAVCKGFCRKHYQQIRSKGKISEKGYIYVYGLCKILNCKNKAFAKGYCQKHYTKLKN